MSEKRGSGVVAPATPPLPYDDEALRCLRCGHTVPSKPWGCKNPCANCGFIYPLGDCSD